MARLLITAFILCCSFTLFGQETIHEIAKSGDLPKLKAKLEKDSSLLNSKDDRGLTPLHFASSANLPVVTYLVGKGALVNARSNNGTTPLYTAVRFGRQDIAEFLLAHKADINAKSEGGSVMHQAVYRAPLTMLVFLLTYPADLTITDKEGQTVIHCAATWNADSACLKLIEAGADLNARDKSGNTPLHCCLDFASNSSVGSTRVLQLLISHKALLNEKNNEGLTPLALARKKEAAEIIKLLEAAGATE